MSLNDKPCCGNCKHRIIDLTKASVKSVCFVGGYECLDTWDYVCNKFEFKQPLNGTVPKHKTCRHIHVSFEKSRSHALICSKTNSQPDKTLCESCKSYKARWLQFPIEVNEIINSPVVPDKLYPAEPGTLCRVRLCGSLDGTKPLIGIYAGELPDEIYSSYDCKTKSVVNQLSKSTAIFVPELKRLVYGCECFWSVIKSRQELKDLVSSDTDFAFYSKFLKPERKKP